MCLPDVAIFSCGESLLARAHQTLETTPGLGYRLNMTDCATKLLNVIARLGLIYLDPNGRRASAIEASVNCKAEKGAGSVLSNLFWSFR